MPTETTVDQRPAPLPPVDKNVKVPPSVAAAAKRAEAYYQPPAGDSQAPGADLDIRQPDPRPQLDPVQPPAPAAPVPPTPAAPPPAPVGATEWEQRYNSMKGRFDKSEGERRELNNQLAISNGEILQLKEAVRRLQQPPAPAPQRLITPQEQQDYGEEFLNVAKKASVEALGPHMSQLAAEVAALKQKEQQNAIQWVYEALARKYPNWEEINNSPQFVGWLRLRDPFSGAIRHESLTAAFQAADAPRVVAIFDSFISEVAAYDPAPQPTPTPAQQPPRQAALKLEDLAAPGRARSAPANQAAEKPIFTRADINKFYADSRRGVYRGRDAEYARIEAEIFAAQHDGRVRG